MVTTTFGAKLRQFRLRSYDPQTGRYLTQEKLGSLMGEEFGNGFSAQAVSDWERDQSQIHKDHRNVLITLIRVLYEYGGINTSEEADQLLSVGNYRRLNPQELSAIFKVRSRLANASHGDNNPGMRKFALLVKQITLSRFFTCLMGGLMTIMTWFGISPILTLPFPDRTTALQAVFLFTLTGTISPLVISWIVQKNNDQKNTDSQKHSFLYTRSICITLGFNLGSLNILSLMLAFYHLKLYPLPKAITLLISAWPVLLTFAYGQSHSHMQISRTDKPTMQILLQNLLICARPLPIGMQFLLFSDFMLTNLLGPLLTCTEALGLGIILYIQHHETR